MRAPWHPDWNTEDEEEHARIYHPAPVEAYVLEVYVEEPGDELVDVDGAPLVERIPFGFQVPKTEDA